MAALSLSGIIDGRYRVDGAIGKGGFGDVYAGVHLVLGVRVAIKVLRVGEGLTRIQKEDLVARFLDEGRLLTRLRHPNIVAAIDLGLLPGGGPDGAVAPYLVMEWVDGETLASLLARRRAPFSLHEAWALFEPLAEALAHAHGAAVVHRDLKPDNVMVVTASNGPRVPRVIDFGVAKLIAPEDTAGNGWTETTSRSAFTPAYAAPEQITQSRTGPWTDVHALALLFVELVTGAPPYGDRNNVRIAAVDPLRPTPRALGVDVGPLEPVIAKALALRPIERYANATELLAAARAAMQTIGVAPIVSRGASVAPVAIAHAHAPANAVAAAAPPAPSFTEPSSNVMRRPSDPIASGVRDGAARPTPSFDPTAPPASHTLASNAPRAMGRPRVSLRRIGVASLVGAIAIAGVAGFIAMPRVFPRATPTTPSASVTPAPPVVAPTLDSLSVAELAQRLHRAGVVDSIAQSDSGVSNFRTASWLHGSESWIVTVFPLAPYGATPDASATDRAAIMESIAKSYGASGFHGGYGYDDAGVVVFQTTERWDDAQQAFFDKVFDGIALLDRGPLGVALHDGGVTDGATKAAPAKRVRDLSREELASRLTRNGVEVSGTWGGDVDSAIVSFTHALNAGVATIYRKNSTSVLAAIGAGRQSFAYAVDGDVLVVIYGSAPFTTKAFLAKVLAGLGSKPEQVHF